MTYRLLEMTVTSLHVILYPFMVNKEQLCNEGWGNFDLEIEIKKMIFSFKITKLLIF